MFVGETARVLDSTSEGAKLSRPSSSPAVGLEHSGTPGQTWTRMDKYPCMKGYDEAEDVDTEVHRCMQM